MQRFHVENLDQGKLTDVSGSYRGGAIDLAPKGIKFED